MREIDAQVISVSSFVSFPSLLDFLLSRVNALSIIINVHLLFVYYPTLYVNKSPLPQPTAKMFGVTALIAVTPNAETLIFPLKN